jgi:hypothetical protein
VKSGDNSNEEIVEVDVPDDMYSNDFYEWNSQSGFLAPIHISSMNAQPGKPNPHPDRKATNNEHPICMHKVML